MRAVSDAGYTIPTPIQGDAIPVALSGADLVGTAQTGTGKTAAFVLPILQHLLSKPSQGKTRALIVCPTRELAEQIHESIRTLAKHTRIRSNTVYGGVSMGFQTRALRDGTDIIVACPGRLLDHVNQGNVDFRNVKHLVLDEADRMFDMGFLPQVRKVVALLPKQRQTLLFSATMPREVEELAREVLQKPERINIGVQKPATTVMHALYPVEPHLKAQLLVALIKHTDAYAMLVFTRTKHRADKLARAIEKAGFPSAALHGDRSQGQRQRALDDFKRGKLQVLVATDIASRGLDIETVSHVINYDVPATPDDYIHRIGRTGRAERTGDAFTLVTHEDRDLVRDIERAVGKPIERRKLDDFDYGAKSAPAEPRPEPANQVNRRPAIGQGATSGGFGRGRSSGRPQGNGRNDRLPMRPPQPATRPASDERPAASNDRREPVAMQSGELRPVGIQPIKLGKLPEHLREHTDSSRSPSRPNNPRRRRPQRG